MNGVDSYIKRFELDKLLSPDLVTALSPMSRGPGELIISAGDPVRDLLFLVEGRAKASYMMANGESILAAFFKPLEVFGEVELFAFAHYTMSVYALTETVCLGLSVERIKKAADRNCRLFMDLCGRLGTKLVNRVVAGSINLRYPVVNRLASYLLSATDRRGWLLGAESLGELANFLGASYRQVARAVRLFRDEGILDETRGRIRVVDRSKLAPLAGERYGVL